MKVFYFTATGNCLEVAKAIGGELLSIPQVLRQNKTSFEDEAIGIIFPCYALSTPPIVVEFLQRVELKSNYIFAIMTYGNFEGGGVHHFSQVARRCRVRLSYLNSIIMADNYLNFFKMEDQINSLPGKNVAGNLANIVQDVQNRKEHIKNSGFLMKSLSFLASLFGAASAGDKDKSFSIENSCNGCKVCEKVCPVNNIEVKDKPEFRHKCISCLACTHNCPQNAIRLRFERSKTRYRNPNVELNEIIKSNE